VNINVKQGVPIREAIVQRARELVRRFEEKGVAKDNVVISIPANEDGVHAARTLTKEYGILVDLVLVTSASHAAVCAETGAAWITFHVDRVSLLNRRIAFGVIRWAYTSATVT
jgi:transaldolase